MTCNLTTANRLPRNEANALAAELATYSDHALAWFLSGCSTDLRTQLRLDTKLRSRLTLDYLDRFNWLLSEADADRRNANVPSLPTHLLPGSKVAGGTVCAAQLTGFAHHWVAYTDNGQQARS